MDVIEKDNGQYNQTKYIFWASGAALFIRSEVYKKVGGLDADFFAHMEEIDLCWRIKNLGGKIMYCPKSIVYHVGGATLPNHSSHKLFLNFRNNLLMLHKNLAKNKFISTLFLRMIFDGIAAFKFLFGGEFSNFKAVLKAHYSYYSLLKKFQLKRKKLLLNTCQTNHNEIYSKSIIVAYYLKKEEIFLTTQFLKFLQSNQGVAVNFKPTIATSNKNRKKIRAKCVGSPNNTIPRTAVVKAPIPVQMA